MKTFSPDASEKTKVTCRGIGIITRQTANKHRQHSYRANHHDPHSLFTFR